MESNENPRQDTKFPISFTRQISSTSTKSFRRNNHTTKRYRKRLIKKSGGANVHCEKDSFRDRYLRDLSTTLINSRWRWTFFVLVACFVASWFVFACCYFLISLANDDWNNPNPCVSGIDTFGGYFMFSIETQQTIGYGSRMVTNNCPEGAFMLILQMVLSGAICGAMVSLVNVKLVRPTSSASRGLFSKKAVICMRDGTLCLIFRVRDEDSRHAIGTNVCAYLVQTRVEEPYLKALKLEPYGLLLWPLEVVHKITKDSPFWDLSAQQLVFKKFEILVTMVGVSSVTGQSSKSSTSYLSDEILWGSRFVPCVLYDYSIESYRVDHALFNKTKEITTPLCSMKRLLEVFIDVLLTPDVGTMYRQEDGSTQVKEGDEDDDEEEISRGVRIHTISETISIYDEPDVNTKINEITDEQIDQDEQDDQIVDDVDIKVEEVDVENLIRSLESAAANNIELRESYV